MPIIVSAIRQLVTNSQGTLRPRSSQKEFSIECQSQETSSEINGGLKSTLRVDLQTTPGAQLSQPAISQLSTRSLILAPTQHWLSYL